MKDFEYYEKKPESSIRSLSDLERYEIFNLESAEKYDSASNIDFIIDEEGNMDYIDCELIGYSQFNNLLNDLKIIGDEAKPIKIKTKMKGGER